MSGSTAMRQTLQGDCRATVPAAPLYLGLYLEPRRRRHLAGVYREMASGARVLELTCDVELEARVEAWRRSWDCFAVKPSWMPTQLGFPRSAVEGARVEFDEERCLWYAPGADTPRTDYLAIYDSTHQGVWEQPAPPQTPAAIQTAVPLVQDMQQPDPYLAAFPRRLQEEFGREHLLYTATGTPFWLSYGLFGFAGLMENLRRAPHLITQACERQLHNLLWSAEQAWQAGLRAIFVEECFSGSDLISRADYLNCCWPFTRDLLAGLKRLGFAVVFYHTGGVEDRLDLLASCAADALAFEESKKAFEISLARIRREVGAEKVLFGNLDVVLLRDSTAQQIEAELQQEYAQAGPRFVASTGSPLTLDTQPQQADLLIQSAAGLRA